MPTVGNFVFSHQLRDCWLSAIPASASMINSMFWQAPPHKGGYGCDWANCLDAIHFLHAGYTAGHALEDLHCIMHLHMSIARIRALMYASAHPSSTPAPCQHDSSAMPANGVHVSAQAQHSTAEPSESLEGSVKHKRPLSGEAGDMQVLRAKHSRQVADISINGQPHDREHHAASKGVDGAPSIGDDISSLRWQCQHSSMVSIVTVGCSFAQLHVALKSHVSQAAAPVEPDQIQDNVKPAEGIGVTLESPLPQLKVTLHWSCGNSAGSGPPASVSLGNPSAKRTAAALEHRSRCHVIAEPEIHASASEELAAMAGMLLSSNASPCAAGSACLSKRHVKPCQHLPGLESW